MSFPLHAVEIKKQQSNANAKPLIIITEDQNIEKNHNKKDISQVKQGFF